MQKLSQRRDYHPVSKRGYLMNVKTSHPFHCAYIDRDWYKKELKREYLIKRHPYLQHNRKLPHITTRRYIVSKKWRVY